MYRQAPTEEEAAKFGYTVQQVTKTVLLWPDNLESVHLFTRMAKQWRTGYSGPTGLDYSALPVVFDLLAIPRDQQPLLFADLCVMEDEALTILRRKANANG